MTTQVVKSGNARRGWMALGALALFAAVMIGTGMLAQSDRASWKSDLIEISVPPGEYALNVPSHEIGRDALADIEEYAQSYQDRNVRSTGLVVVIGEYGRTSFHRKIHYTDK